MRKLWLVKKTFTFPLDDIMISIRLTALIKQTILLIFRIIITDQTKMLKPIWSKTIHMLDNNKIINTRTDINIRSRSMMKYMMMKVNKKMKLTMNQIGSKEGWEDKRRRKLLNSCNLIKRNTVDHKDSLQVRKDKNQRKEKEDKTINSTIDWSSTNYCDI